MEESAALRAAICVCEEKIFVCLLPCAFRPTCFQTSKQTFHLLHYYMPTHYITPSPNFTSLNLFPSVAFGHLLFVGLLEILQFGFFAANCVLQFTNALSSNVNLISQLNSQLRLQILDMWWLRRKTCKIRNSR